MSGDKAGEEADYGKGVIFYLKVTFVYHKAVFICLLYLNGRIGIFLKLKVFVSSKVALFIVINV